MRNSISKACVGLAFLCMTPATGFAEEKSYVCAINEVYECVTVTGCSRVSLEAANVAGIISKSNRSNFARRPLAENLARMTSRV